MSVIDLARLHCVRSIGDGRSEFQLVDVPVKEAKQARRQMVAKGFVVTHTEVV